MNIKEIENVLRGCMYTQGIKISLDSHYKDKYF